MNKKELEELPFFIDFFKLCSIMSIFFYLPLELLVSNLAKTADLANYISSLIWTAMYAIFTIVTPFLMKYQNTSAKPLEKKVFVIRILFAISFIFAPIIAFEYYIINFSKNTFFPNNKFKLFWISHHLFLMVMSLVIFMKKPLVQILVFLVLFLYYPLRISLADYQNWGECFKNFLFSIYLLSLLVGYFSIRERSFKDNFKSYEESQKLNRDWKRLFSYLPQSVIIISEEKELKYSSNKLEKISVDFSKIENINEFFLNCKVTELNDQNYLNLNFENEIELNINTLFEGSNMQSFSIEEKIPNLNYLVFPHRNKEIVLEIKIISINFEKSKCKLILIEDISEKNLIEILKANDKFKNRMLSSFSHELKTPLSGASTPLENSLHDTDVPEKVKKKYLLPIKHSFDVLELVIDDIIDFGSLLSEQFNLFIEEIDVNNLILEIKEIIQALAKVKNLDFHIEIEELEKFHNDKLRIKQVLMNILRNAIKFTNQGEILLKISQKKMNHKSYIQFEIIDTGAGMKLEEQEELKNVLLVQDLANITHMTGGGLGLIISQSIAKNIGPKDFGIFFESEYQKGSKFSFYIEDKKAVNLEIEMNEKNETVISMEKLSIDEHYATVNFDSYNFYNNTMSENLAESKKLIPEEKIICKCPKIMIVDDESFNILALEMMITSSFEVLVEKAYNGKQAVEIIEKYYKKKNCDCPGFKLILMDIQMPKMNGIEATKCLKELEKQMIIPRIPIVACTAFNGKDDVKDCFSAGMVDFLTKPVLKKKLTLIIEKYM